MQLPHIIELYDARQLYDLLYDEIRMRIMARGNVKIPQARITQIVNQILLCAMWEGIDVTVPDMMNPSTSNAECYVIEYPSLQECSFQLEKGELAYYKYYIEDLVWINTNNKKIVTYKSAWMNFFILIDMLYKRFTDPEPHLDFEYSLLCQSPQDLETFAIDEGWLK